MSDQDDPPTYEPYSVRKRNRERQGQPVIYRHDELPQPLLAQIVQILDRVIGTSTEFLEVTGTLSEVSFSPFTTWKAISQVVAYEAGVLYDGKTPSNHRPWFVKYLRQPSLSIDAQLDAIEIAFRVVEQPHEFSDWYREEYSVSLDPDQAIRELNRRFRMHDIGFQFAGGQIIQSDSEFMHSQVVEPTIMLLQYKGFERPEAEFMEAYQHYRRGELHEAIVDAGKALESVLKIALERHGVILAGNENASVLIPKVTDKILPPHLRTQLQSLVKIMETVPSLRNKPGVAHGAGSRDADTLDSIAGYALNVTAATILFVVERLIERGD